MEYRVKILERAQRDLSELYRTMNAEHSAKAQIWYKGMAQSLRSLGESPRRCPLLKGKGSIRNLLYGDKPHIYRLIYHVIEKQKRVDIMHIRHGARLGDL